MAPAEAAAQADVVMVLVPDELQADLYREHLAPNLKDGAALAFAHGFNIHFRLIEPRRDLDVFMIAPKGPGPSPGARGVRAGRRRTLPGRDPSGCQRRHPRRGAVLWRRHRRRPRRHHRDHTFREECETDLFGEQVVLCGGLCALIQNGYDTLVEAGYAPRWPISSASTRSS